MSGGTRQRRRAGEVIEFALAGPIIILMVFGIIGFGISAWQRSAIDYELSHMAEKLPDDWASRPADEVVSQLVLANSSLDPAKLTVSRASIREDEKTEAKDNDPVAQRLGSDVAYRHEKWVTVTADVEYDATGPLALAGKVDYKRTVEGTYLVERRYEVS